MRVRETDLQGICENTVDEMDSVLGCALVDWVSGLPIASDIKDGTILTDRAMTVLFSTAAGYFAESSPSSQANPNSGGSGNGVWEIQTTTKFTFHFMAQVPGNDQMLLVLVVDRKHSSLGLGWMAMRQTMDRVCGVNAEPEHPTESPAGARAAARLSHATSAPEQKPYFRHRGSRRRTVWDRP